jgi:hypothetical protein
VKKLVPAYAIERTVALTDVLARGARLDYEDPELGPEDLAFLQYTGGTTGVAKGAMLTHRNMVANVLQSSAWMQPFFDGERDTAVTALPLYHIFALTVNLFTFIELGARNLLITNPRDMAGFIRELDRYRPAFITGVNTLFNGLLNTPGFEMVVKNVAGYDLTKLQVGGFGGFGIIAEVHLRLRALPRADVTVVARGPRDTLTSVARDLIAARLLPGALELLSPALAGEPEWTLAARFAGTDAAVQADVRRLGTLAGPSWLPLPADRTAAFWSLVARGSLGGPITLRLGVLGDGVDDTIDLLAHDLDEGLVSAGAGAGMIRWTGDAPVERLRAVRRAAASREIPMTLERAPWPVRRALGHFGAYREGVGQLVGRLRDSFDPGHSLSVALEGD